MSVCPPDLVHLVDLQSVQIEDPQALLSRRQCNDIFTSLDVERQSWFAKPGSFSRWIIPL